MVWLVCMTGVGLVRAGVVISVGSYFLVGIVVFVWLRAYIESGFAFAVSMVLMMCPPMTSLGRETSSDAPATLIAFLAMYLIFEKRRLGAGMALLLASIYFRTDFVVLAGPAILACWLERRMEWWKAGVLALVAVASVLCINHFGGSYGMKVLYHHTFVDASGAPGEVAARFTFRDYVAAFKGGVTEAANSFFLPFLLMGMIGSISGRMRMMFAVAAVYACLHFLALPHWEERYFAVFYLVMGVCAVAGARGRMGRAGVA
jgi:hypothetical protein